MTLTACRCCYQMVAVVTIGFVKDAKHHIDVQGFNVYHKNRLIKVFISISKVGGNPLSPFFYFYVLLRLNCFYYYLDS